MIIFGAVLISIGVAGLLGLSYWPILLIGLGTGLVLSGISGKIGWPQHVQGETEERRRGRRRHRESAPEESS